MEQGKVTCKVFTKVAQQEAMQKILKPSAPSKTFPSRVKLSIQLVI
jgi:hypothetical protein